MKVGFLIIARLKSTRLPEKLLREVYGRPIFAYMIDRLKLAKRVDQIVICTSTNPQDDRLADLALTEGVAFFRGHEDDVLKRLYDAAVAFDIDYILSITADCPFVDPAYADRIVGAFESTNADLILASDLPHGAYSWGIKPSSLKTVLNIKDDENTEVWGRYFTDTDLFHVYNLPIDNPFHRQPSLRMTLDYQEDLEFFKAVFTHLHQPGKVFSLDDILNLVKEHPEIPEINRHCAETYKKRWTKQSDIRLKPRHTVKRAAVIGCGSIGQRHIRNLRELGITDIVALRTREGHFKEIDPALEVREVQNWEELTDFSPDVAIVSNPTSLHLEAATRVLSHVRGLFIEKPIAPSLDGVKTLWEQIKARKAISFVGYNLQFHPVVRAIQDILESEKAGKPISFQCQVGQWLPDWHPYEDYLKGYYARKDLGGGAALTLIHEVHLALELMGRVEAVSCLCPRSDLLPLDVEVIADMQIQHISGAVSQIHLDYIQRPIHRCGVISCERGWIRYDLIIPKVVAQFEGDSVPHIVWEESDYDATQQYIEEMRTFLRYVSEGRMQHEFDIRRGIQSLAVVETALLSAKSGYSSNLPAWVSDLA